MKHRCTFLVLALAATSWGQPLELNLRSRVEAFKGSGQWSAVEFEYVLPSQRAALIICDMWDKHWCQGANMRVGELVRKAVPVIDRLRERGILVIHSPSDTMNYYSKAPQRLSILQIPRVTLPSEIALSDPALPVDSSDGGCDTPGDREHRVWTSEHAGIAIHKEDLISDNGDEIYSALRSRGITHLLVMGVHTNMCILNRSFAIRRMTRLGVRCILIRDLTDAMYDPQDRPHVSHEQGTELVVQHIEKYWCPTVLSTDVLAISKEK
jgi:nicotinamidase-related amidase